MVSLHIFESHICPLCVHPQYAAIIIMCVDTPSGTRGGGVGSRDGSPSRQGRVWHHGNAVHGIRNLLRHGVILKGCMESRQRLA